MTADPLTVLAVGLPPWVPLAFLNDVRRDLEPAMSQLPGEFPMVS